MVNNREYRIQPSGHLVSATISQVCEEWLSNKDLSKFNVVILDLEHVTFMDSSAIACVVKLNKECKKIGCYFAVFHCNDVIKDLMYNLNLNQEFPID